MFLLDLIFTESKNLHLLDCESSDTNLFNIHCLAVSILLSSLKTSLHSFLSLTLTTPVSRFIVISVFRKYRATSFRGYLSFLPVAIQLALGLADHNIFYHSIGGYDRAYVLPGD